MDTLTDIAKKILSKIKCFFWVLGLHAFGLILVVIFIEVLIGGFMFYRYVIVAQEHIPQVEGTIIQFNENAYNSLLSRLLK